MIPKPLLIVVIVLLVLGVASCAMGLLGGRDRCNPSDGGCRVQQRTEISADGITGFLKGLIPDPPPVAAATLDPAACAPLPPSSPTTLASLSSCTITIDPTDDLRRRFRLKVSTGTTTIQVTQDVAGSTQTQSLTVPGEGGDTIEVVVGRRAGATATVRCLVGPCQLSVP